MATRTCDVVDEISGDRRHVGDERVGLGLGEVAGCYLGIDLGGRLGDDCVDDVLCGLALADSQVGDRLTALQSRSYFIGGDAKGGCDDIEAGAEHTTSEESTGTAWSTMTTRAVDRTGGDDRLDHLVGLSLGDGAVIDERLQHRSQLGRRVRAYRVSGIRARRVGRGCGVRRRVGGRCGDCNSRRCAGVAGQLENQTSACPSDQADRQARSCKLLVHVPLHFW